MIILNSHYYTQVKKKLCKSQHHSASLKTVEYTEEIEYRLSMLILHIASLNPKPSLGKHNFNQVKHFAKLKNSDFT
jgi:hypothetical protein